MQNKRSEITQIHGALPLAKKILLSPRRSYAELEQALQKAESITERTLCELLALQQSQLTAKNAEAVEKLKIQPQLNYMIKQAQRHGTSFAVLLVQLDHFKSIEDSHGAAVSHQVSEATFARIVATLRDCDSISQKADDQFLLLITDVSRVYDAVLVAEKLKQKLSILPDISVLPQGITVSIGISRFPQDGNDASVLIERATAALLHAQNRGGNQFSLLR